MTQTVSPSYNILEESEQLIAALQQHPTASAQVQDMLEHHIALREELTYRQEQSEQSLAAWREALQRRWHCEISGQRMYTKIVQQLRSFFGPDSPQLQIIEPHTAAPAGSAADLLNDMWRLHATLMILQPGLPCDAEIITQFEYACQNLDAALKDTVHYEEQRRRTSVEYHLAQDACWRTMEELTSLLAEQADIPNSIYATVYTNGQTSKKVVESRYVEV
jgi:hypothetical protein